MQKKNVNVQTRGAFLPRHFGSDKLLATAAPADYFEGSLFRKSIVQIRATVLKLRLRLKLGLGLGLGLALAGIVNFRNSGPSE